MQPFHSQSPSENKIRFQTAIAIGRTCRVGLGWHMMKREKKGREKKIEEKKLSIFRSMREAPTSVELRKEK